MVTWTRNPVAVDVVAPNNGRSGASSVLPDTVAAPFSNPVRAVVAEIIALEPTVIPVTVTRPFAPREICGVPTPSRTEKVQLKIRLKLLI